jgi:tetratricopeptide (TPR) repeat protein
LGLINHAKGNLDAAAEFYSEAIRLDPSETQGHLNLGKIHCASRRLDAARACFEIALQVSPSDPDALCSLGEIYAMQGNLDKAIQYFDDAIETNPDFGPAHADKGLALSNEGRLAESAICLRNAIRILPQNINAWLTLGSVFLHMGQLEASIVHYEVALEKFPQHPAILLGLGACHAQAGNYSIAEIYLDRLLAAVPALTDARFNRALLYLVKGDYLLGFSEYECRLQKPELLYLAGRSSLPIWQGEPLAGKKIVLLTEQGFGDSIQFIRFARQLADMGATVHVETETPLLRLLASADGVATVSRAGDLDIKADFYCPMMSLPHRLGVTSETVPTKTPYFRLDNAFVGEWKSKLTTGKGLKVGIAWASNPENRLAITKSISLPELLPLLEMQGVTIVSLQVAHSGNELKELPVSADTIDLTGEIRDFYDTACLIANLDLVVTIDSAVAHLAGALGKPVWVVLHHAPDWRWHLGGNQSRWYPSARLFRQTTPGNWAAIVADMVQALRELMHGGEMRPISNVTLQA